MTLRKLRKTILFIKLCQQRVATYIAMLMMGAVLLKQYQISLRWYPVCFLGIWAIILFLGWLDYRLGFHGEDFKLMADRNPVLQEHLKKQDEILKILKEKK